MPGPAVWVSLSDALKLSGDLSGAVDALRSAPGHPTVRAARAAAERRLAVSRRVPDFATGRAAPANPAEAVLAAEVSVLPPHQRYGLAYRLYAEALAADPGLATITTRYSAASAAVRLAGGYDPSERVTDDEWRQLHRQARAWLWEVAAALRARGKANRAGAYEAMIQWQQDPDLASVRDPVALATMPAGERAEWELVWAEVAALARELAPRPTDIAPAPRPRG